MKQLLKKFLVDVGLRHPAKRIKVSPERKAQVLLSYKSPNTDILVETGTEFGTMIDAVKTHFKEIHSVELNDDLFNRACKKFDGQKNIHLYHGDSAQEISKILQAITTPALFWLDAHGGDQITFENSPIQMELSAILHHPIQSHVILIDDARHFSRGDIKKIERMARVGGYRCVIDEGLFRLTPSL